MILKYYCRVTAPKTQIMKLQLTVLLEVDVASQEECCALCSEAAAEDPQDRRASVFQTLTHEKMLFERYLLRKSIMPVARNKNFFKI